MTVLEDRAGLKKEEKKEDRRTTQEDRTGVRREENVAEEWEGRCPTGGEVSYIVCVIGSQILGAKKSPHSPDPLDCFT